MSVSPQRLRRAFLIRAALSVVVLVVFAFQVLEAQWSAEKRVGIVVMIEDVSVAATEVTPRSPAADAGLLPGDIIRAIDGEEVVKSLDYDVAAAHFGGGGMHTFTIERNGELFDVEIQPGMAADYVPLVLNGVVVFACLTIGLMALGRRPGSLNSTLLFQMVFLLAAEVAMPSLTIGSPVVMAITTFFFYLIVGAEAATEFHLISFIPERRSWLDRWPWLVPLSYVVNLGFGALTAVTYAVEDVWKQNVLPWDYELLESSINGWWLNAWAAGILLLLVGAVVRYPKSRRYSGLVLAGVAPWVLYIFVVTILDTATPTWVDSFWSLSQLSFPVSVFIMLRLEDHGRNQVLRNLIHEVQDAGSMEKISELISNDLELAFHTRCNYVFFRERRDSDFTSVYTSGSHLQVERIPNDYQILQIVDAKAGTLAYDEEVAARLPTEEREWLDLLEANLVVPLIESDGHMTGLLILGRKRSEEPYTPDDLELLRSLAHQITVAYENLSLQLQMQRRERLEREFLDRLDGEDFNLAQECPSCGFCYDAKETVCPRDNQKLTYTLPIEREINERYRLEQVLGRGGVAVVYLATDLALNRGVAIKVLARSVLDDVHAPRRFEREARLAAQLIHPHIVTTLDFGKTRNDLPYIVMEFLEGRTLRQVLKRAGSVEPVVAARWFSEVLDGLGEAHSLGVIHRDLKPDNVFLVGHVPVEPASGKVKLLDFGLAKVHKRRSSEETQMTAPGTIMGTLSYMAPEQLSGFDVDPRTDIYSIGVMAYETVVGRRPFAGRSAAQLLNAICSADLEFPGDTPETARLGSVLRRAMASERSARYESADAFRLELTEALAACPPITVGQTF